MQVVIPVSILRYTNEQYNDWVSGKRDPYPDPYCKGLPGSFGFGESLVGSYFTSQGYQWIHHDYNFFGGNRLGKYPMAEDIILRCFGKEKYESTRTFYKSFKNIEEPDLLVYKPDYSEVRFAESKRFDTHDKIRESQVRGLALFALLLGCKVDIFEIVKEGIPYDPKPIIWEF